jgi:hypothetical protein
MLRGQEIAIYSDSPALVSSELYVAVQTVNQRRQFRAEEENVDAAEFRNVV